MKKLISKILIMLILTAMLVSTVAIGAFAAEEPVILELVGGSAQTDSELILQNLFPGDNASHTFNVKFTHEYNFKLFITINPYENSSVALAENILVKVTVAETGEVVMQKKLGEYAQNDAYLYIVHNGKDSSTLTFVFDFFLPEEAGNDCANQLFTGEIRWVAAETEVPPESGESTIIPPVDTGDSNNITKYFIIGFTMLAFVGIIVKNRRKAANNENR